MLSYVITLPLVGVGTGIVLLTLSIRTSTLKS